MNEMICKSLQGHFKNNTYNLGTRKLKASFAASVETEYKQSAREAPSRGDRLEIPLLIAQGQAGSADEKTQSNQAIGDDTDLISRIVRI
mmetsp:Transcript_25323/g.31706  ORF Transcript_25323/g.31706 Transcript_25323/m.31706 type:complete len:89 (+) Transcript_25323:121-387(+)